MQDVTVIIIAMHPAYQYRKIRMIACSTCTVSCLIISTTFLIKSSTSRHQHRSANSSSSFSSSSSIPSRCSPASPAAEFDAVVVSCTMQPAFVLLFAGLALMTAGACLVMASWSAPVVSDAVETVRRIGPVVFGIGCASFVASCFACAIRQRRCCRSCRRRRPSSPDGVGHLPVLPAEVLRGTGGCQGRSTEGAASSTVQHYMNDVSINRVSFNHNQNHIIISFIGTPQLP